MTELEPNHTLAEVAKAMHRSTRWVRDRIRLDGVEHLRVGRQIFFTAEQFEKFRASLVRQPEVAQSITTGRKRKSV